MLLALLLLAVVPLAQALVHVGSVTPTSLAILALTLPLLVVVLCLRGLSVLPLALALSHHLMTPQDSHHAQVVVKYLAKEALYLRELRSDPLRRGRYRMCAVVGLGSLHRIRIARASASVCSPLAASMGQTR
jgi:hypothetical protein